MDRALTTLEELGAIDNTGTLTALGKHIVGLAVYSIYFVHTIYLTVNPASGHQTCQGNCSFLSYFLLDYLCQMKMLILATVFQCLGPIVTVAALLSSKPLFLSPMEKRDEAAA